jgi:glycosyltransferase involved in cell wall biosynthesis
MHIIDKFTVSVIIPTFNEEKYIEKCVNSVLNFEIPLSIETEIIIVDGMSTDDTLNILLHIQNKHGNVFVLRNSGVYQSFAINKALEIAKGKWIMRLDAHSIYPNNYLKLCVETAERTGADNVGGLVITLPGAESYQANLVQALTTHKFGVGNSGFRVGAEEGPSDTVPYGFFSRNIFNKIGLFDQRLVRAQDYEFNRRIIVVGGKVWCNPAIQVFYFNHPTLTGFLIKQFKLEAPYNAYMWYLAPYTFAYRHAITGVFALGIILGIILSFFFPIIKYAFVSVLVFYSLLAVISSIQQAIRFKQFRHILLLPFSFFLYHFIHGLGVLKGIEIGRASCRERV